MQQTEKKTKLVQSYSSNLSFSFHPDYSIGTKPEFSFDTGVIEGLSGHSVQDLIRPHRN